MFKFCCSSSEFHKRTKFLSPAVTLLDISNRAGVSLIGQDQLMATPTTSYSEKCSTDDQNSIRTEATLTRTSEVLQVQEPNEDEIGTLFYFIIWFTLFN